MHGLGLYINPNCVSDTKIFRENDLSHKVAKEFLYLIYDFEQYQQQKYFTKPSSLSMPSNQLSFKNHFLQTDPSLTDKIKSCTAYSLDNSSRHIKHCTEM